jgi:PAS domain S-box-containing protein
MFKNILSFNYQLKNLQFILDGRYFSSFSANGLAPAVILYLSYPYIETNVLIVWVILHAFFLVSRLYISNKLQGFILSKSYKEIKFYFNLLLSIVFSTGLLNPFLICLALLNGISPLDFVMLSIVVITLSAGSIATTVSIFKVYVIFILLSMLPLIGIVIYHGEEIFYIYGVILTIFTFVILKAGYKQHYTLEEISSFKETFETIYQKSHDTITLMKNNRLYDCNPATLKMFGYETKEELINAHLLEYMPMYQEDGSLSFKKLLQNLYQTNRDGYSSFEWLFTKKDGSPLWCEIVFTKIMIDGEVILHGVYRDINERKEFQKKQEMFQVTLKEQVAQEVKKNREKDKALLQQSRLAQMGEMISMIAHQWRQPLSAISAASGSLSIKAKRGRLTDELSLELSSKISQYAQHLSVTIEDFRNFFKEKKVKEKASLSKLVQESLNIVTHSLEAKKIVLVTEFKNEIEIETYTNEVKQVLLNIIKNAEDILIEKNIENPKIYVKVDFKTVTISDNGGGIDNAILDKIFEPYFSTKTEKDGTGLGLYMSKTIIEQHCKGRLGVENIENGALFSIEL